MSLYKWDDKELKADWEGLHTRDKKERRLDSHLSSVAERLILTYMQRDPLVIMRAETDILAFLLMRGCSEHLALLLPHLTQDLLEKYPQRLSQPAKSISGQITEHQEAAANFLLQAGPAAVFSRLSPDLPSFAEQAARLGMVTMLKQLAKGGASFWEGGEVWQGCDIMKAYLEGLWWSEELFSFCVERTDFAATPYAEEADSQYLSLLVKKNSGKKEKGHGYKEDLWQNHLKVLIQRTPMGRMRAGDIMRRKWREDERPSGRAPVKSTLPAFCRCAILGVTVAAMMIQRAKEDVGGTALDRELLVCCVAEAVRASNMKVAKCFLALDDADDAIIDGLPKYGKSILRCRNFGALLTAVPGLPAAIAAGAGQHLRECVKHREWSVLAKILADCEATTLARSLFNGQKDSQTIECLLASGNVKLMALLRHAPAVEDHSVKGVPLLHYLVQEQQERRNGLVLKLAHRFTNLQKTALYMSETPFTLARRQGITDEAILAVLNPILPKRAES